MSWSWTAFVPLSDAHASPDAAHLCGERVVVELTEETHFHIDSDIDLRRVRRRDEDGRVQREADVMTLRVRSASHFSAGVECWISRPKLRLKCGPDATVEDAWAECLPWLRMQAETIGRARRGPIGNLARSHAIPSADPSGLLSAVATSGIPPPFVAIRRRCLRSAVPSERGVLVEQSDLEAGGRLWRAVCCEAGSPANLRTALAPLRELLYDSPRFSAPPLVVSPSQFLVTVLRASAPPPEQPPHGDTTREQRAASHGPPTATTAATPVGGGTRSAPPLTSRLLDAWYESSDVFCQRIFRAAQEEPVSFLPTAHAPNDPPPRPLHRRGAAAAKEGEGGGDGHEQDADEDKHARKRAGAAEGAPAGVRLAPPIATSEAEIEAAAAAGEAVTRAGASYGLLALFPGHVVRRALGEAATPGDAAQLEQLLLGSRGAHVNTPCGMPDGARRTPLQCAAAHGRPQCVQLLLRHCAEPIATCEGGRTALHLAATGGSAAHAECARLLLRYGCDATQPDLRGVSPIEIAAAAPSPECHRLLAPLTHLRAGAIAPTDHPLTGQPRGPLRYSVGTPAPPPAAASWVPSLLTAVTRDATDRSSGVGAGAWWCMDHPAERTPVPASG